MNLPAPSERLAHRKALCELVVKTLSLSQFAHAGKALSAVGFGLQTAQ